MSELLFDPSAAVSAVWLDVGCVWSSRLALRRGGHWSTNRCHGNKEGVDWPLERPHSSTHTPERTPGSHTLFISHPSAFLFCLTRMTLLNWLFFKESGVVRACVAFPQRGIDEAHLTSLMTAETEKTPSHLVFSNGLQGHVWSTDPGFSHKGICIMKRLQHDRIYKSQGKACWKWVRLLLVDYSKR